LAAVRSLSEELAAGVASRLGLTWNGGEDHGPGTNERNVNKHGRSTSYDWIPVWGAAGEMTDAWDERDLAVCSLLGGLSECL